MNMKLKAVFILLLLLGASYAAAFEFQIPIKVSVESAGYEFEVPDGVYQKSAFADLRDVRVINALGDEVPMRLFKQQDEVIKAWSEVTLPVFSLNNTKQVPVNSKQVKTTWSGEVQSHTVTTTKTVRNYLSDQEFLSKDAVLVDASTLKGTQIVAFELQWSFPVPGNRVFYVELSGSNDLSRWQTIEPKYKLIELDTGDRLVLENRLPLKGFSFDYYRLRFPTQPIPEIIEVKASMQTGTVNQNIKWRSVKAFDVLDESVYGHVLEWELGGYYPVMGYEIDFDYKNLMADLQLFSRFSKEHPWQPVTAESVYAVGENEMSMFNNQLFFNGKNHPHWKLISRSAISSQWVKGLSFAFRPYQIQFLAQGEGPYALHFSSVDNLRVPDINWYKRLSSDLRQGLFSNQVELGALLKIKKPAVVEEPVMVTDSYSRWIFWGLLTVVLILLLVMATKLLKEVSRDSS